MKTPIYVRALTPEEQAQLKRSLHSKNGFEVRRSQIVLARARQETACIIARHVGCDDQTVRNVIKQFSGAGLEVLHAKSHRPHHSQATFTEHQLEALKDILHQSPRTLGKATRNSRQIAMTRIRKRSPVMVWRSSGREVQPLGRRKSGCVLWKAIRVAL